MNVFIAKMLMYHQVQQLTAEGYSVTRISTVTGLHWRTVKKYIGMTAQEFEVFQESQSDRKKQLQPYEQFVKGKLELYRDTSAAQMHDWLKEHHSDFPNVSPKTVFNFVQWVRRRHNLPLVEHLRDYETVPESAYGKQAQVDFGESTLRTSRGGRIKVFFFCMSLSRSRYKYLWFITRPFTSELAVYGHEKAFAFFDGIAEVIVYDQDKVFMVSENKGDLMLTAVFKQYVRSKGFKLHFCRKSDPESKGKVENVIKYVKRNFLYNRTFHNEETLNDEAIAWLARTANAMPHAFTRKVPREEWLIEKPMLKPYIPEKVMLPVLSYLVRKDNTISWKGNFYSVPFGTYQGKGSTVLVRQQDGEFIIMVPGSLQEICKHTIPSEQGLKVIKTDHKRDKSLEVEVMMLKVANEFDNPDAARHWIGEIYKLRTRYMRDQLQLIQEVLAKDEWRQAANRAMYFCHQNNVLSANDFRAIVAQDVKTMKAMPQSDVRILNPLSGDKLDKNVQPERSKIKDYQDLFTK
jgi:transposase